MNVCSLQHAPFEGPGAIETWAAARGYDFSSVRLYQGEPLPDVRDLDLLVVMGGPMSVHDEAGHPWLMPEKKLIKRCLAGGKFTLGICLGSQLLAEVLGAQVYRNRFKEIGWLPVEQCADENNSHLFRTLPRRFNAFHWHGETYDLPPGTIHLARSEGCAVQAFEHAYGLGLQFHLEMTPNGVPELIRECAADIGSGPYEQTPDQILAGTDHCTTNWNLLAEVLDGITARVDASRRIAI